MLELVRVIFLLLKKFLRKIYKKYYPAYYSTGVYNFNKDKDNHNEKKYHNSPNITFDIQHLFIQNNTRRKTNDKE